MNLDGPVPENNDGWWIDALANSLVIQFQYNIQDSSALVVQL